MKRLISICLLLMMVACGAGVAETVTTEIPESFDYEGMSAQYYTDADDMEAISYIYYEKFYRFAGQVGNAIKDSHLKTGYTCSISPSVLVVHVGGEDELPMFRVLVQYSGKKALNMQECIFKVGDMRYKFDVINNSDTGIINIGVNSTAFMEALCAAKEDGSKVTLRMSGPTTYYDFDITPNVQYIAELYEAFVAYGGTNEKYLNQVFDQLKESY